MWKFNLSFMTKMTLMIVVLIVLTAITVGLTTSARARGLLMENQLQELGSDVEVSSVRLESNIDALRLDTIFLSNLPEVDGIRRAIEAGGVDPVDLTTDALWRTQLIGIFSELLASKPQYIEMQYISVRDDLELVRVERSEGVIQVRGRRELRIDVDDQYYLAAQPLDAGDVYLSDIGFHFHDDELVNQTAIMYASTPIYSDDGTLFGVIVIGVDFGATFDELLALKKPAETLYVTNQQGDLLLNSANPEQVFGFESGEVYRIQDTFESLNPLFDAGNTLQELPASTDTSANSSAVHFKKVPFDESNPDRYLGIAVAKPYSTIVEPIDSSINQGIMVTGIVAAIGILLGIGFARFLIRPLYQITLATQKVSEGQFDVDLDIQSKDEFGQLATGFNQMAKALQQREQELIEVNASLEQRVEERTLELRHARDEALAAQRLANENSRLKSEFLSTMSHELRTPMNAIEGFAGIMLKRMAGVDYNEKTERYLNKIQSNSRRLLGLINDFLDLSRIESGRFELAHLPICPGEMVHRWEESLGVLAERKALAHQFEVDPELPQTIYGDEEALSKLATNLFGNAVKFTSSGSVKLALKKNTTHMVLEVTDTGIGIPPHARDYIFDEFRQVDQSSKREYGGTGLGLTIVQRIAREMGGTVSLNSEVGAGSTFTVSLPISLD